VIPVAYCAVSRFHDNTNAQPRHADHARPHDIQYHNPHHTLLSSHRPTRSQTAGIVCCQRRSQCYSGCLDSLRYTSTTLQNHCTTTIRQSNSDSESSISPTNVGLDSCDNCSEGDTDGARAATWIDVIRHVRDRYANPQVASCSDVKVSCFVGLSSVFRSPSSPRRMHLLTSLAWYVVRTWPRLHLKPQHDTERALP
jgi:hypothetical protein